MKPIRIAVIGAGHLGRIHAKLLSQVDGAELVGIVDPVEAARDQAASLFSVPTFTSHRDVLNKIDAAVIASPSDHHAEVATELLIADKHVFVEKPMTTAVDDAQRLARLATTRKRTLQVGHVERFNPVWTSAVEVTRDAKYIEAVRASRFPGRCLDVGVVMDLMIHDIDLVLSLTDAPLRDVRASGIAVVSDHEDLAEARLEFECGLVANLKASRISPSPARRMTTYGPRGYADIDFGALKLTAICPDRRIVQRSFDLATETDNPLQFADPLFANYLHPTEVEVQPRNAILDELHDFVISIRSSSSPTVSGLDGARAVDVATRVLRQIELRRWSRDDTPHWIGPKAAPPEGIEAATERYREARRAA